MLINSYMAITDRIPSNFNILSPVAFDFSIHMLPNVTYFIQTANLPDLSLGSITIPTPVRDYPIAGDQLELGTLDVGFLVDEDLANYLEIWNWMRALGGVTSAEEYARRSVDGDMGISEGGGLISDYDLTTHFEDVILLDDVVSDNSELTYNEVQLNLYANADKFIGISGGSTLVLNLFQKPTITYLYNKSDLREKFWEDENGNKNIKNYYYMMNPNVIPYIDVECEDMRQNKFDNFLNLIKETIK